MSEITLTVGLFIDPSIGSPYEFLASNIPIMVKCARGKAPITIFTHVDQVLSRDIPCPCGHPQCWVLKWKAAMQ